MPTKVIRSDTDTGSFSVSPEKMTLEWVYKVAGNFNEYTCRTAIDDTTGLTIPTLDSPHTQNDQLLVTDITANRIAYAPGFGPVHEVRVTWVASVSNGGDLLPTYTEYQWDFEEENETVDHDVNGRAFVNTVYDPIRGGYQITRQIPVLKVWRQEPVFDVARAYQTSGRVNQNDMAVLGYTVPKGSMILWSYRTQQPLRVGTTGPIKTELTFKFKEPKSDSDEPWQARLANVGFNGFGASNAYGPFRPQKSKDFVTEPVPLDDTGLPLYGDYYIGNGVDPPAAVGATNIGPFYDTTFPKRFPSDTTPRYWTLIFQVRKEYDFSNFIPGIM